MSGQSKIEWTDASWNPVRGCSRVSAGCMHCYAERQAIRGAYTARTEIEGVQTEREMGPYHGLVRQTSQGPKWTGQIRTVPELLEQPLRWRKPRRIFVNSMSDLFHEDVPEGFILRVLDVVRRCSYDGGADRQHVFQVLTKRPAAMRNFMERLQFNGKARLGECALYLASERVRWPTVLKNLWLGVSVEDQAAADERISLLLETPAAVRWISAEPLLGPIDLTAKCPPAFRPNLRGDRIAWVVAGGESGPGARPSHPDWFRSLRDQCQATGVPFFFKQWGMWEPFYYIDAETKGAMVKLTFTKREIAMGGPTDGTTPVNMRRVGKRAAGRLLDGRTWDEYPA